MLCEKSYILKFESRKAIDRFIASLSHFMCARDVVVSFLFNVIDKVELISGCHKAIDGTKRVTNVIMNIKQIC